MSVGPECILLAAQKLTLEGAACSKQSEILRGNTIIRGQESICQTNERRYGSVQE
jgi:hypothetical protein